MIPTIQRTELSIVQQGKCFYTCLRFSSKCCEETRESGTDDLNNFLDYVLCYLV